MKDKILNETDKNVDNLPEEISEIIYYGSMAPNSHNTQLWKVSVDPEKNIMKIYLDEERTLKKVDSENREAYISIGAFTTNILMAFEAYGYETDLSISEIDGGNVVLIKYKKLEEDNVNDEIINAIMKRHTDKRPFLNKNINDEDIEKVIDDNNVFFLKSGSESFEYIKKSTVSAMEKQAYDKNKAEEFSKWLRLSDKETIDSKDGLSAEQLGLTGFVKSIYYLITTHESAKEDSYAKQSVDTTKKQVDGCSGFFIITGGTSDDKLIKTGMLLERTWLKAVEAGISIHPMSQALEEEPYCDEISDELNTNMPVQMVLRAGYVKEYGENNKIRRDLCDYVTVKNISLN